jgi:hypothetical protein
MSKMKRWIDGNELMKMWDIKPIDLIDLILEGKITPYDFPQKTPYDISKDLEEDERFSEIINANLYGDPIGDHKFIEEKIGHFLFKFEAISNIEKEYQSDTIKEDKLSRKSTIHKERCRAIAALMWAKDPKFTIEDMISSDAINKYGCENKVYHEKTLRKWINDLCPNRNPGRRPNPQ